jgi:hypothetical protein
LTSLSQKVRHWRHSPALLLWVWVCLGTAFSLGTAEEDMGIVALRRPLRHRGRIC